jgi:hypothetical protein
MVARLPWLLLYVFANIASACIMFATGELVGDVDGTQLYSGAALIGATTLVVFSYIFLLGPVFNTVSRIEIKKINFGDDEIKTGKRIGFALILLQIAFMAFNLTQGVNMAGSNNERAGGLLSMVFVLLPSDALFIIYYGFYRNNKYFYPNLAVWLLSNVLRGWAGVFLFLVFVEWCRAFRRKKITVGGCLFSLSIVLVLYPILTNLKWLIRLSASSSLSLSSIFESLIDNFGTKDYFSFIWDGVTHILFRLQTTSLVVEVMRMRNLLQSEFANGNFVPFWLEGLHGIIIDRFFSGERSMPVGVAFTQYLETDWQFNVGDWNTNIGYVGWFFITPYLIPLYLAYTVFLGFLSFFFIKKIGSSESTNDLIWYAWMTYLMAPWLATFVSFIYALAMFLILKVLMTRKVSVRSFA